MIKIHNHLYTEKLNAKAIHLHRRQVDVPAYPSYQPNTANYLFYFKDQFNHGREKKVLAKGKNEENHHTYQLLQCQKWQQ